MTPDLQNGKQSSNQLTGEIAAGILMLRALDHRYTRLLESAKREWKENRAGPEPSDVCVRVDISREKRSVRKRKQVPSHAKFFLRDS